MRKKITSILVVTMVLCMVSASAQNNFSSVKATNTIDVSGYAEVEVEPNLFYLNVYLNESDTKGKVSVESMEKSMAKVLKKAGVDVEEQLRVKDMSSNLKDLFLRKDQVNTSKVYSLKLNSLLELTNSVTALEAIGISNINIDRVSHSNLEQLRDRVRVLAIKNAKDKAALLTKALDVKLGSVIFISDAERTYTPSFRFAAARNVQSEASAAPKLEFEKVKINHNVGVTFNFSN